MTKHKEIYVPKLTRCPNCGRPESEHHEREVVFADCPLSRFEVRRSIAIAAGLVFYRANFIER